MFNFDLGWVFCVDKIVYVYFYNIGFILEFVLVEVVEHFDGLGWCVFIMLMSNYVVDVW